MTPRRPASRKARRTTAAPRARRPGEARGAELAVAFRSFVTVSRKLERAYDRLRARCERIDFALSRANEELRTKVVELDAMTRYLEGLLSGLPVAVVATDAEGRVRLVNPAAESALGRPASLLVGRLAASVCGGDGQPLLVAGLPSMPGGEPVEREIEPEPGRRARVIQSLATVRGAGGGVIARLEMIRDVTETRRLEDRVRYLDAMAAVGEMAAIVAHEIRSPLNGVLGFASLLRRGVEEGRDRGETLRFAQRVEEGVRRVEKTVNDLLAYARPESIECRPVSLASLLDESLEEAAASAPLGAVRVSRRHRSADATALGDPAALRRVFTNLLRNAIEAMTPDGGAAHGRLLLSTGASRDAAWASVRDTGPGLPPEVRARLFSPFVTTRPRGVGLGLATVLKLMSLQGGRVEARGSDGPGATFVVELPRAPRTAGGERRSERGEIHA